MRRYRDSYIGGRYLRDGYAVKGYQDAAAREAAAVKGNGTQVGDSNNGSGEQPGQPDSGLGSNHGWLSRLARRVPFSRRDDGPRKP